MDKATEIGHDAAARAVEHADRKVKSWSVTALECVRVFALMRTEMTSETVREFAEKYIGLAEPPDERAWGGILPSAARKGYIRKKKTPEGYDVYVTGANLQSHGRPVRVWVSLINATKS